MDILAEAQALVQEETAEMMIVRAKIMKCYSCDYLVFPVNAYIVGDIICPFCQVPYKLV